MLPHNLEMNLLDCRVNKSKGVLFRPVFWVIAGWVVIYLLPSIFYGGNLVAGLSTWLYFLVVLYVIPIAFAGWLLLSNSCLELRGNEIYGSRNIENPPIVVLGLVALAVVGFWLYQIPFKCSAGWALIFDPERMLLAREVAGKLSKKPNTWRLIGAYIDVIAPLLIFICGVKFVEHVNKDGPRKMLKAAAFLLLAVVSFSAIFLTGTKGSLLPVLVVSAVALAVMPIGWLSKFVAIACVALLGFSSVVFLQFATASDRLIYTYPLGACVVKFDACQEGLGLIESASARKHASILGSPDDMPSIVGNFETACHVRVVADVGGRGIGLDASGAVAVEDHLSGLWERAFIIPLQVASWYSLYASEYGKPGINSVPMISRINGGPNMAKEVYQRYGALYSGGDVTSTSTAPTSFLLAYPVLMGPVGLFVAITLLLLFDGVVIAMLRQIKGPLLFGFVGLSAVAAYHFLNGDFFTVLGGHGGFAFLVMVFFFPKLHRFSLSARSIWIRLGHPLSESVDRWFRSR